MNFKTNLINFAGKKRPPIRSSGPFVVVCLALVLLLCNFLWLYSGSGRFTKGYCPISEFIPCLKYIFTAICSDPADAIWGLKNDSNETKSSTSTLDYQRVRGSGLGYADLPLTIPNETLLYGFDIQSSESNK